MAITQAEIDDLELRLNAQLAPLRARFHLSPHFALDRINHPRNRPAIALGELEAIFTRLIRLHLPAILSLHNGDTFNVRCTTSHINMPCMVRKSTNGNSRTSYKYIVMTVMRKQSFFSKDPVEFQV